jgi:hypothetical protein
MFALFIERVLAGATRSLPARRSALGIRVLELSVDPAAFAELPRVQQRLFRTTDVLMTGAVLGAGAGGRGVGRRC